MFFHGNDLAGEFYRPLAERLQRQGITSHLLTLPGFSGCPPLTEPSWPYMLSHIEKSLEQGTRPGTYLVGHSLGAMVALLALHRNPKRHKGIILLEPGIMPYRKLASLSFGRYRETELKQDRNTFKNTTGAYDRVAYPNRFPKEALKIHLKAKAQADMETVGGLISQIPTLYPLPKIAKGTPCLILLGEKTGWKMRIFQNLWLRQVEEKTVKTISDSAHFLVNENDEEISHELSAFIKSHTM